MVTNGPFLIPMVGWAEGLGRLAMTTALAFLLLLLLRVKSLPGVARGLFLLISGTLVFAFFSELIAVAIFGPSATRLAFVSGLGNAVLFFSTTVVLGIARVAHRDSQGIRSELEHLLGNSSWQGQLTVERDRLRHREVAELLHGHVQNRLLSVVLALTSRPPNQKHDDFATELAVIENTLFGARDTSKDDRVPSTSLLESEVAQLATRWAGIIAVSTVNGVAGDIAHPLVTVVGRAGEEAISNAVRHGLASAVEVRVEKSGDDIVLTVTDNGVGPRSGHPGLGSLYLTQVAGKRWSLKPGVLGAGSLLTARLRAPSNG
jgi:two-component system sensor histidine kinase DesK